MAEELLPMDKDQRVHATVGEHPGGAFGKTRRERRWVALIQRLVRKGVVSDCVAGYGHLIVDQCHHLSAHSFEQVARRARAKYVLGLSATVTRKDGHHPIIFMQCGPVRYRRSYESSPTSGRRSIVSVSRNEASFRVSVAGIASSKKNQTCPPRPERDRSTAA